VQYSNLIMLGIRPLDRYNLVQSLRELLTRAMLIQEVHIYSIRLWHNSMQCITNSIAKAVTTEIICILQVLTTRPTVWHIGQQDVVTYFHQQSLGGNSILYK